MKTIGRFKYDINEDNSIYIWIDDAEAPFLHQPFDPRDGKVFESVEDATSWAEEHISDLIVSFEEAAELEKMGPPPIILPDPVEPPAEPVE